MTPSSRSPSLAAAGTEPFGSAGRVALEVLGGVIGATALGLAGAGAFAFVENDVDEGVACDACGLGWYGHLAFGAAGALIGLPLGVYAAGEWSGARGSLGATYVGELGGAAVAGILGGALYALDADRPAAGVLVLSPLFVLGGALLGRELSTRPPLVAARAGSVARLPLTAAVGPGRALVMLDGAF